MRREGKWKGIFSKKVGISATVSGIAGNP